MQKSNMKVFHGLINYGTQAGMLALGLRKEGICAKSFVWEDPSKRMIDVDLSEKLSKVKYVRWLQELSFFLKCLKKYNIFHFYFGISFFPHNLDLPILKLFGKKIVMEYLGTDVDLWLGLNGRDWRNRPVNRLKLVKRVQKQAKQVDAQLVCSPHYYQFVDNSIILPLAIDIEQYQYTPRNNEDEIITFMHCPTNRLAKKTDYIEAALNRLKEEGYKFNYKRIENVTHSQLKEEYKSADVIIDQLNHWYGTVSVEAMALGRPVVAGYYNHYLLYDDRFEGIPIIQADVKTIYQVLKDILDKKYDLKRIGEQSRIFVEKVHSLEAVTKQLIGVYESL